MLPLVSSHTLFFLLTSSSRTLFLLTSPSRTHHLLFVTSLLHKVLDAVQPTQILLLLLDINVIRHDLREVFRNASCIEVALQDALHFLVELLERWTRVKMVWVLADQRLGITLELLGQLHQLVDHKVAIARSEVEFEGALVGSLDEKCDGDWEVLWCIAGVL